MTDTTVSDFEAAVDEDVRLVVEHVNESYPDTVALVAGWAGGRDPADARIVDVDRRGMALALGGADTIRLEFAEPVAGAQSMRAQFLAQVTEARAAAPEGPLTSLEQAYVDADAQREFRGEVVDVVDLSPRLRQVTLGEMHGFASRGFDQVVSLMVPPPERPIPTGLSWSELWALPPEQLPHCATYTIRGFDPERGTVDVWIVLHGDEGGISAWASQAEVGDVVVVWGPRGRFRMPDDTTAMLLVCDETALGAVAAIIDDTDPAIPVHVVAEVDDARHAIDLPGGPRTATTWVFRGGDEPGTGTRLLDTVRELDLDPDGLFAFGAAEAGCIMQVRRHLRGERGLGREQVSMGGYWRRRSG